MTRYLTTYARSYLLCILSCALMVATVWGLGFAFDLYALGWNPYLCGALPVVLFLCAAWAAYGAEALEPDPLPPALIRLPL